VEIGIFLGLVVGAGWVYEHANPSVRPVLGLFFMLFGFLIGVALLVRVLAAIKKEIQKH
jgi:hypothetical protein